MSQIIEQATIPTLEIPSGALVNVKIEVSARVEISSFVARQKANRFLIMQAGDQLCAGPPELVVGTRLSWRMPIQYAPSRIGVLGVVGYLLIDAATGEITIAEEQTTEDLLDRAEVLYERHQNTAL